MFVDYEWVVDVFGWEECKCFVVVDIVVELLGFYVEVGGDFVVVYGFVALGDSF